MRTTEADKYGKEKTMEEIEMPLFSGFYYTEEDAIIESCFNQELDALEENGVPANILIDAWKIVDWQQLQSIVAKKAVDVVNAKIESLTGIPDACEFRELWSPVYYNYTTDKIYISIKKDVLAKIRATIETPEMETEEETAKKAIECAFDAECLGDAREYFILDLEEAAREDVSIATGFMIDCFIPAVADDIHEDEDEEEDEI